MMIDSHHLLLCAACISWSEEEHFQAQQLLHLSYLRISEPPLPHDLNACHLEESWFCGALVRWTKNWSARAEYGHN